MSQVIPTIWQDKNSDSLILRGGNWNLEREKNSLFKVILSVTKRNQTLVCLDSKAWPRALPYHLCWVLGWDQLAWDVVSVCHQLCDTALVASILRPHNLIAVPSSKSSKYPSNSDCDYDLDAKPVTYQQCRLSHRIVYAHSPHGYWICLCQRHQWKSNINWHQLPPCWASLVPFLWN